MSEFGPSVSDAVYEDSCICNYQPFNGHTVGRSLEESHDDLVRKHSFRGILEPSLKGSSSASVDVSKPPKKPARLYLTKPQNIRTQQEDRTGSLHSSLTSSERLSAFKRVVPSRDLMQKQQLPFDCKEFNVNGLSVCSRYPDETADDGQNEDTPAIVYGYPEDPGAKHVTVLKVNM